MGLKDGPGSVAFRDGLDGCGGWVPWETAGRELPEQDWEDGPIDERGS